MINKNAANDQKIYNTLLQEMDALIEQLLTVLEYADSNAVYQTLPAAKECTDLLQKAAAAFGIEDYDDRLRHISRFLQEYSVEQQMTGDESYAANLTELREVAEKIRKGKSNIPGKCICCGEEVYYRPLPKIYERNLQKYGANQFEFETLNSQEYICPCCNGSDRDRLIVAFLEKIGLSAKKEGKILQFAPSNAIEHWIVANCESLTYHSTDKYMEGVTFQADIQKMDSVEDGYYDYIICSHVLEHVEKDDLAMKELYRILSEDGTGILLVPICLNADAIDEEWGLSEEENWRRFGQNDHCRLYNKDGFLARLKAAGFYVRQLDKEYFGEEVYRQCGLQDSSVLYVLSKEEEETKND